MGEQNSGAAPCPPKEEAGEEGEVSRGPLPPCVAFGHNERASSPNSLMGIYPQVGGHDLVRGDHVAAPVSLQPE